MKLLFCHDGPIAVDKDGNAYPQTFTEEVLSRYYTIADDFTMLTRTRLIDPKQTKIPKANMERFRIVSCPNLASIKEILVGRYEAKKILKKEMQNCDYLIIRLPSHVGNLAIQMARKMNKPYLVEVVACPWDAFWNHSLKGKLVAPFMYFATKKRVKNAPYSIYVTNEFLQKRYPTKGKSVNCSNVALKEFDDNILKARLDKINSMRQNQKIVIGTTAAVDVRYKGQQYVIQSLGKLKKQGITIYEYQLVGSGDPTYLKLIAEKNNVVDQVKFLGVIPHKEVFEWLETIDIYIQPSFQEGLPRAVIEAMSRGVPCIGSDVAGIPELLEPSFIFKRYKNKVKQIVNIISKLYGNSMIQQSERNYNESKLYDKQLLEDKRKVFFERFKKGM